MDGRGYPLGPAEAGVLREAGRRLRLSGKVPDVVRDKGGRLSRADRRAIKERQGTLFLDGGPSQIESVKKGG